MLELCGLDFLFGPGNPRVNFPQGLLIFFFLGQLEISLGFLNFKLQIFPEIQNRFQGGPLLEDFLGIFIIIPKICFEGFLLDLLEAGNFRL
jgi:hypothetical protein